MGAFQKKKLYFYHRVEYQSSIYILYLHLYHKQIPKLAITVDYTFTRNLTSFLSLFYCQLFLTDLQYLPSYSLLFLSLSTELKSKVNQCQLYSILYMWNIINVYSFGTATTKTEKEALKKKLIK